MRASDHRFSNWATAYEDDGLSRLLGRLGEQAVTSLCLEPTDRFVDVGCGSGAAVRRAASVVRLAVGVDQCEAMIERAHALATPLDRARFLTGDAHHLPLDDGSFTALACTVASRHFVDLDRAIGEMARVLAPGGRLCLIDLFSDPTPRRRSRLNRCQPYARASAMMRTAGLVGSRQTVHLTPFGPYFVCLATKPPYRDDAAPPSQVSGVIGSRHRAAWPEYGRVGHLVG